jgi:hypothetical protein
MRSDALPAAGGGPGGDQLRRFNAFGMGVREEYVKYENENINFKLKNLRIIEI